MFHFSERWRLWRISHVSPSTLDLLSEPCQTPPLSRSHHSTRPDRVASRSTFVVARPLRRYYQERYDFLPPIPPRFVSFAWRYLGCHSFVSLLGGRVHRRGLELVDPVAPAGILPRRRQDLPSSWGISIVRLHMFLPTPAGLLAPDPLRCSSVALGPPSAKAPTIGLSDAQ